MKSKAEVCAFPSVTKAEVEERLPKSAAIFFRLTEHDKRAVDAAAKTLHLTTADYLLKCHEVISEKLLQTKK